jgi:hypothetical protein
MGHACCGCRAMPMLLVGREPNDVTWSDLLDRPTLTLNPATAGRDDQGLTQWMCVPCGAGTWLERDAGTGNPGWFRRREQAINAHPAGKIIFRAFAGWL